MIKFEKRKEILYRNASYGTSVQPVKRVSAKDLPVNIVNLKGGSGLVGKRTNLEGFRKIKVKPNLHKCYFAMMNDLEKDIRKDHYITGQEDLILYDLNDNLIGGF